MRTIPQGRQEDAHARRLMYSRGTAWGRKVSFQIAQYESYAMYSLCCGPGVAVEEISTSTHLLANQGF